MTDCVNRVARQLDRMVFGRVQCCLGLSAWILTILGCMSISIGAGTSSESGVLVQEGKIPVKMGTEQFVHYPKPYGTPPNIELVEGGSVCDIIEQKETGFRVAFRRDAMTTVQTVSWKSRGVEPAKVEVTPVTRTGPESTVTPVSAKGH